MLTIDDLEAIRRTVDAELEAHGLKRLPRTPAQRQKEYRERLAIEALVTRNGGKTKTSRVPSEEHNENVTQHNENVTRVTAKRNGHTAGALVWLAYAEAYKARYSVDPVRNAKVNGQLSQLVKRLGDDAAPVAAWFLGHGAARYVSSGHTVGLMLVDCEKLHTEWQTGRRITATAATQSDKTQANGDMWTRLIEEARG